MTLRISTFAQLYNNKLELRTFISLYVEAPIYNPNADLRILDILSISSTMPHEPDIPTLELFYLRDVRYDVCLYCPHSFLIYTLFSFTVQLFVRRPAPKGI